MLLAYLHLAARKSELFRLTWDDVDFEEIRIRLYTRKTKDGSWEEAWLPMTNDLNNSLATLKKKRLMKNGFLSIRNLDTRTFSGVIG